MRSMYLLLVIGGAIVFLPQLIAHEPTARGVIPSLRPAHCREDERESDEDRRADHRDHIAGRSLA
jgi:hypothetical protein